MAASNVNKLILSVAGGIVALGLMIGRAQAESLKLTDPNLPVQLDAASTDFDYKNGVYEFRKVHISQGAISVQADEATANGTNINDSRWTFRGSVHIQLPNGHLDSDTALVVFHNNQIASAHIVGKPATFENRRTQPAQLVRGKAGTIDYDLTAGTVRLSEEASITDGQNEITGQTLVYDITQQRVIANPGEQSDHGVSITINPRKRENTTKPQDANPAARGPGSGP